MIKLAHSPGRRVLISSVIHGLLVDHHLLRRHIVDSSSLINWLQSLLHDMAFSEVVFELVRLCAFVVVLFEILIAVVLLHVLSK